MSKRYKDIIDPEYYKTLAMVESSGNPNAKAGTSSATGLFQFTEGTWKGLTQQLGLDYSLDDRTDPVKSREVVEEFTKQNRNYLAKKLGKEPNQAELYISHFLGMGGGSKLLTKLYENPEATIDTVATPNQIQANKSVFLNKDGSYKKTKEIYNWAAKKFNENSYDDAVYTQDSNGNTVNVNPKIATEEQKENSDTEKKNFYSKEGLEAYNQLKFQDDIVKGTLETPKPSITDYINPFSKKLAQEQIAEPQEQLQGSTEGLYDLSVPEENEFLGEFLQEGGKFDPEGNGYDYETARKYNIQPDSTGHYPSRVPDTGQLLKGRLHKTYDKTVKAEDSLGNIISKGEDGRYYSNPKNKTLSLPKYQDGKRPEIQRDNTNVNLNTRKEPFRQIVKTTPEDIARNRVMEREASNNNPLNQWGPELLNSENYTKENLAEAAKGLESVFRIEDKPNFFDDYLNPANWIGGMAANLGTAPQKAEEQESIIPYVTSVVSPVVGGALAGLGTKTTGQFVNNTINPLAGLKDVVDNKITKDVTKALTNNNDLPRYLQTNKLKNKTKEIIEKEFDNHIDNINTTGISQKEKELLKDMYSTDNPKVNSFVKDNYGFSMFLNKKGLFSNDIGKLSKFADDDKLVNEFLSTYLKSKRGVTLAKDATEEEIKDAMITGGTGRFGDGNYSSNSDLTLRNFSTPSHESLKGYQGSLELNLNMEGLTASEKLGKIRDNFHYNSTDEATSMVAHPRKYKDIGGPKQEQATKPIIESIYGEDSYERVIRRDRTNDLVKIEDLKISNQKINPDIDGLKGAYGLKDSKQLDSSFFLDNDFYNKYQNFNPGMKKDLNELITHYAKNSNDADLTKMEGLVEKLLKNEDIAKSYNQKYSLESQLGKFELTSKEKTAIALSAVGIPIGSLIATSEPRSERIKNLKVKNEKKIQ